MAVQIEFSEFIFNTEGLLEIHVILPATSDEKLTFKKRTHPTQLWQAYKKFGPVTVGLGRLDV